MSLLRAKMFCRRIVKVQNEQGQFEQEEVELNCVYDSSPENRQWSKWTPSGEIKLVISNPEAFGKLKVGDQYFIDISPAGKEE